MDIKLTCSTTLLLRSFHRSCPISSDESKNGVILSIFSYVEQRVFHLIISGLMNRPKSCLKKKVNSKVL